MEFEVREITPGDLRENKGFFETLSNLSPIEPMEFEKSVEILHNILVQGSKLFVAVLPNGTVIGCATIIVSKKVIQSRT